MNRTTLLKIFYALVIAASVISIIKLISANSYRNYILIAIILLFLLTGRLVGYFWRDLIIGRRLMDQKKWGQAIPYFEQFLCKINQQHWLSLLIWIAPSLYTTSASAMALNNIGASHLELGDLESAEVFFQKALSLDKLYSIPHWNLAAIEFLRGNRQRSDGHLLEANRLGYSNGTSERLLDYVKSIYARIEPSAQVQK